MARKLFLIPALMLGAVTILPETASAQPFRPLPPGPAIRTAPVIRPSTSLSITFGAPIAYPVYRPIYGPVIVDRPMIVDPICYDYRVVFRDCAHEPWRTYRVYHSHRLAHEVADELRYLGYEARVLHH